MNAQEVPPEHQPELTPPEKVEQLAGAYLVQEDAFVTAMANDVLQHMETAPERFANKLLTGIRKQRKHNAVIAKFKIGEPVEIAEVHVVELFLATTWVGWVVRIALYLLFVVACAKFFEAWMLPQKQPIQQVQIQQQEGRN